jgi:hypothetical protein
MSHARSLRFEALEPRELLSKGDVALPHKATAAPTVPLVLDGTLAVNNNTNAALTTMNVDGTTTTSLPVSGRLGDLGAVHGVWNQTVDTYGDITGLDALRLHDSKGTFIIAFDNEQPGPAHPMGHGGIYYEVAQKLYDGTGAYAGASEIGTIKLVTNSAPAVVYSMTLHSRTT